MARILGQLEHEQGREAVDLAEGVQRALGSTIQPTIQAAQERLIEAMPHILPGIEWGMGQMERPEFQSWMQPLEGPSRAVGALIQGGNLRDMFEAAGSQEFTMDEDGRMRNAAPLVSEALIERGVNPILAGMAEFLVPDPTGARKVGDLIPLFALIGPAGLRAMRQFGGDIGFMPAHILVEAAGNPPRRSPAQQTLFRRTLSAAGGIEEPVMVVYDPNTMRWKVGEGNHRALAALEADSPVPTVAIIGSVPENQGLALPPEGATALRTLLKNMGVSPDDAAAISHKGLPGGSGKNQYSPSRYHANPSEVGLPTYDPESMIRFAQTRADNLDISEQEINEAISILEHIFNEVRDVPFDKVGRTLSRVPEQVPDYTPTLQRLMRSMGHEDTSPAAVESFVDEVFARFGEARGNEFFEANAGLTPVEIEMMRARWRTTAAEAADLLDTPPPGARPGQADTPTPDARATQTETPSTRLREPGDVVDWDPELGATGVAFGEMAGHYDRTWLEYETIMDNINTLLDNIEQGRVTDRTMEAVDRWLNAAGRFEVADASLRIMPREVASGGPEAMENLYLARSALRDAARKVDGLPPVDRTTGARVVGDMVDDAQPPDFHQVADEGAVLLGQQQREALRQSLQEAGGIAAARGVDGPGFEWVPEYLATLPNEDVMRMQANFIAETREVVDAMTSGAVQEGQIASVLDSIDSMRRWTMRTARDDVPTDWQQAFFRYLDTSEAHVIRIAENDPSFDPIMGLATPDRGQIHIARKADEVARPGEFPTHADAQATFHNVAEEGGAVAARQQQEAVRQQQELSRAVQDAAVDFAMMGGAERLLREAGEAVEILQAGAMGEETLRHAMMVRDELSDGMAALMSYYRTKGNMPDFVLRRYEAAEAARWAIIEALP